MDSFHALINRLKVCYEYNNPSETWDTITYCRIAWQWIGKEDELKRKVIKLESKQI